MTTLNRIRSFIDIITGRNLFADWTVDFDLTLDDLVSDLDPGWMEWRESLNTESDRLAA